MSVDDKIREQFAETLREESVLLDQVLVCQDAVHKCVVKRNWIELDAALKTLGDAGSRFAELDSIREGLDAANGFSGDFSFSPLLSSIRSKLLKSKIQNKVLNEYISTTKGFLQKVFDEALPEGQSVTYSRHGKIVKGSLQNVVVNQIV